MCLLAGRSIAVGAVQRMSHRSFLFEEKESVCVPCAVCVCVCVNPHFGCKCISLCLDMSHQMTILKKVVFLAVNVYRHHIRLSWAV